MKTFSDFNPDFNNQQEQFKTAKGFKDSQKNILFLVGGVGVGKSHLAGAICNQYGNRDIGNHMTVGTVERSSFVPARDFHFLHYEYMFPNMEYTGSLRIYFKDLFNRDCVIIDDLGTEPEDSKGYFISGFQDFLDRRFGKLVVTTNYTESKLKSRYGGKIYSRLCENMEWCSMAGKDYRRQV